MPNHCANSLKLTATTPENRQLLNAIRAAVAAEEGFFQTIDPCPAELLDTRAGHPADTREPANLKKYGFANWYDFQLARWGTKWDAYEIDTLADTGETLMLSFDTAWSPPVGIYQTLHDMGFEVEATYCEQGCDFVGYWINGTDHTDTLSHVAPAFYDDENGFAYEQLEHYFTRHHIDHSPAHFGG
jgi:hypothetical protein